MMMVRFVLVGMSLALVVGAAAQQGSQERDDGNLIARLADCDVLTVTGDDYHATFTVSGQVMSKDGAPVEDAIVLLRESSTGRIRAESSKYVYTDQANHTRTPDVFARTMTDADGRFSFRDVKSPAIPKHWTNAWRGDVVAAHEVFGLGWVALGSKKEKRRLETGVTVVLKPTGQVSAQFVSPTNKPIGRGLARMHRLVDPARRGLPGDYLDLQKSQLTPYATVNASGGFTFSGVPEGLVALVSVADPDSMGGGAAIATSPEVTLGSNSNNQFLRQSEVVSSPALITADPGKIISGRVVDAAGKPIDEVQVRYSSTTLQTTTDRDGKFQMRVSSSRLKRDVEEGKPTSFWFSTKIERGFLFRSHQEPTQNLVAGQPLSIQMEKGVLVSGRVVTDDGQPVAGAVVRPIGTGMMSAMTQDDGSYRVLLPPGQHRLLVGTDLPGFELPSRNEVFRARTPKAEEGMPHIDVDTTNRTAQEIPEIFVSKTKGIQVIVSLPDGKPAIGATVIAKDLQRSRSSGARRSPFPPRAIDRSEPVATNNQGRAELLPRGRLSEEAYVDVKLADETTAYDASVPIREARDGVLNVVLRSGWIVEGRVLLDGEPLFGAKVSIGQSTPHTSPFGGSVKSPFGGRAMGFSVSNFVYAITGKDGWYRVAVASGKEYSVSVQSIPDSPGTRPGMGYRPTAVEGDSSRLRVKDFHFLRGHLDLAGHVVDSDQKPVAGARVQIMGSRGVAPSFWIGHRDQSQPETDAQGKFHLKNVPPGTYHLTVYGPRLATSRRTASTRVQAKAGTTDLSVMLDTRVRPELPRLEPKRIEKRQPTESD